MDDINRLVEELHAEFPFGEVAGLDRVPEVPAMIVRVGAGKLHRFIPDEGVRAELRRPVKLDER